MQLTPRQSDILNLARHEGRVTVETLAAHFDVTPQTVRKDLNELCDRQLLSRVHGGAIYPSGTENLRYERRRLLAAEEKRAIGRAAAALIPEGASLFINIGTTTEAVGDALVDHRKLMVITNNLNVANRLRVFDRFEVIVAGGQVRASDGAVIGEAAVDFIRQFRVDYAIIGASAIDHDGALLDFDYREVRVAQAIIAHARHVILVADSAKFRRSAPVRIAEVGQIGTLVTDHCPHPGLRAALQGAGVRLIETSA